MLDRHWMRGSGVLSAEGGHVCVHALTEHVQSCAGLRKGGSAEIRRS